MRGDNGELIRGRWRAGPSGHGIGSAHPWYAVRGEDTAEMIRYPCSNANERVRVEEPAAPMMHGANDAVPPLEGGRIAKTTNRWEKAAWICCGIEKDEEGAMRMRPMRMGPMRHERTTEPLFVGATNTDVFV